METVSDEIPKNWTKGRKLGAGAYGDVYLLKDPQNPDVERFVFKKVKKEKTVNDRKNEIVELDVLRRLNHERIVPFYGYKDDETSILIFMGFMAAGSLHGYITTNGALPEEKTVLFTKQILEGTSYLHNHQPKILHRDIKGHNVLLKDDMHAVLADFGVSKILYSYTNAKTVRGTSKWTAPEVHKATSLDIYDEKADVWSIGCTVIEMATSSPPFEGLQEHQVIYQLTAIQTSPLTFLPVDCPTHIVNFLSRIFKFRPADRPSVDELLKDHFITGASDETDNTCVDGAPETPMEVEGLQAGRSPPLANLTFTPQESPIHGKLRPEDEAKIKRNWTKLLEEVDGGHLVPYLYQNCIISRDDANQVQSETTRRKRAEVLLDLIMSAGPRAAFPVFVESLQENYPHLAERLLANP